MKNEENSEKLLALEIEHLKSTNIMENQKIEELKLDYEKCQNLQELLKQTKDLEVQMNREDQHLNRFHKFQSWLNSRNDNKNTIKVNNKTEINAFIDIKV